MINGNLTIARILNPATPYDPLKDLQPVSLIAVSPLVLAVPMGAPTGKAFFDQAKVQGDKLNYGTPGVGTVAHLGMELLKAKAGIAPVHVPYPGNPQVITGLIGGQVQMALLPPGLAMAQVRGGKLQAVGVTSAGRSSVVPEVPSLADAGVQGLQLEIWNAVAAPNSLPKALQAFEELEVGGVLINQVPTFRVENMPYGGVKESGFGREGLRYAMEEMTEPRSLILRKE
jgi:tripartite-type tricarboxylate transporter receptor subunit TctC